MRPSFAFEVVSDDWLKDYRDTPDKYEEIGVQELVIFDPGCGEHGDRMRWQVYRRIAKRGLVRVEVTNGDRVKCRSLGCWLRATGSGEDLLIRIAEGPHGEALVPTPQEREQTERAAKEAERASKEALLARVAELERSLRRRRRSRKD